MSWFTNLFSNFSFPPPADSIRPQHLQQRRLLEESSQSQIPSLKSDNRSPITTDNTLPPSPDPSLSPSEYQALQETGRRRNKLILAAGLTFLSLSILTTRRSLRRRHLASRAPLFTDAPSHNAAQGKQVSGAFEAVEALNIATINVLSVAMCVFGGGLIYFDVNSLGDARRMIRGGLGVDGTGKTEQEADEEIEEVIAGILARKDEKREKRW